MLLFNCVYVWLCMHVCVWQCISVYLSAFECLCVFACVCMCVSNLKVQTTDVSGHQPCTKLDIWHLENNCVNFYKIIHNIADLSRHESAYKGPYLLLANWYSSFCLAISFIVSDIYFDFDLYINKVSTTQSKRLNFFPTVRHQSNKK